jgi:hypothetical protein
VAFEKNGYTLYARTQLARGKHKSTVYFFSKRKPVVGDPIDVPEGYIVGVDRRSGVPFLDKK